MPECSFCGGRLKPGTGLLFVKKDGTPFFFCSRKCEKNLLLLKRKPTSLKWTYAFKAEKEALSGFAAAKAEKKEAAAKGSFPQVFAKQKAEAEGSFPQASAEGNFSPAFSQKAVAKQKAVAVAEKEQEKQATKQKKKRSRRKKKK